MTQNGQYLVRDLPEIPDKIRIKVPDPRGAVPQGSNEEPFRYVYLDVVEAHLKLEELYMQAPAEGFKYSDLVRPMQKWFTDETGAELSASQTLYLVMAIREAFQMFKKKVNEARTLLFGLEWTPEDSPEDKSKDSPATSPD